MPQVRRAARNAWAVTLGGGLERPHATPSEVLHDGPHELLRRFTGAEDGRPVLFVPPLAAPASCFDLRRGQSLAEFLLAQGRSPYVVDYGEITFADRTMGLEDWVDEIIPNALTRTSAAAGGRPVDVVSWSLGGTLSLLTAAAHGDLPIRSITAVGTPVDYGKLRNLAPVRAVERYTGGRIGSTANRITAACRACWSRPGSGSPRWTARSPSRCTSPATCSTTKRWAGWGRSTGSWRTCPATRAGCTGSSTAG